jgi:hypothetical protein
LDANAITPVTIRHVLILGGQSNMAGADALIEPKAGLRDLVDLGTQTAADRDTLFTFGARFDPTHAHSYAWGHIRGHGGVANGKLTSPEGAIYKVIGPEAGLARALAKHGWRDVAIIKAAANFQQLENDRSPWVRPNSHWTHWTAFIHARLAELRQRDSEVHVRGFIWHQGIDDGLLGRSQPAYEADLRQLIADLRTEFGTPTTPFILARSVDSPVAGKPKMAPIRQAQVAVAETTERAAWVDTDDLGPYQRQHHLSAKAQLIVGQRMGEALARFTAES